MYTLKLLLMFKMQSEVHMFFKKTQNLQILKVYEKKPLAIIALQRRVQRNADLWGLWSCRVF